MRIVLLVGLVLIVTNACYAQHNPEKMNYLAKSEKYKRMKHTGSTLTVVGSVLFIAGFVTLSNSTITTYSNGQTTTTGHPEEGAIAFLLGVAGLGSGIPLWIVGARKERQYYQKFENVSLRPNIGPRGAGLTLAYRF